MKFENMKLKDVSIETLKNYLKEVEKNIKNYCADSYLDVTFDEDKKNLVFNEGAYVGSLVYGDGVGVLKEVVERVEMTDYYVRIILKGSTNDYAHDETCTKVIYQA